MSSGLTAGLFPGQGSQTGDLSELVRGAAPELYELCLERVGEDPFARVGEGTEFAQPAIYCASIAGWLRVREHVRLGAVAGHSLGELGALVAAGALDVGDGLELAVRRGALMAAAGGRSEGMLALLGAGEEQERGLAREHGVVLANDNAPGQVVLAGPLERLREVSAHARRLGARAIMLDVAGAFHSPAMEPAAGPFREALAAVEFRPPRIPVLSGATASPFTDDVREELAAAILVPVRWRETMLALGALGAARFVDVGPGRVLARLVGRNLPDAEALDAQALSGVEDSAGAGEPEHSGVA